jgi:hypothetical protein
MCVGVVFNVPTLNRIGGLGPKIRITLPHVLYSGFSVLKKKVLTKMMYGCRKIIS